MKTKKWLAAAMVIVVVGAGLLIWLARSVREPVYQGKTASQWLEPGGGSIGFLSFAPPVPSVIREMGSNAVPSLIRMLHCRDSKFRTKFIAWLSKNDWLKSKIKLRPPAEEMQHRGLVGVTALGPVAHDAIPEVIDLLTNHNSRERWEAYQALEMIGLEPKTAVPAFLEVLKDPSPGLREIAAQALTLLTGEPGAIPALIKSLDDPDLNVRKAVLLALRNYPHGSGLAEELAKYLADQNPAALSEVMDFSNYLPDDPAVLLPALNVRLRDGNSFVRSMAAFHLGEIGTNAGPDVPALRELLTDPVLNVRQAATNALWEIEGLEAEPGVVNEKADITLNMPATPAYQAIELYESWAGHRLVISPNNFMSSPIRIVTSHPVNRIGALKLIEEAVEKEHLILKNGHLSPAPVEVGGTGR